MGGLFVWFIFGLLCYMVVRGAIVGWGFLRIVEEGYDFSLVLGDKGFGMTGALLIVYFLVILFRAHYIGGGDTSNFIWMVFLFVRGVVVMLLGGGLYPLLVGWEILGVVRFILIGYYCTRTSWGRALFTVLINRLGDVGLVLMFWGLVCVSGVLWEWNVCVR